jgi:hypothetical protein
MYTHRTRPLQITSGQWQNSRRITQYEIELAKNIDGLITLHVVEANMHTKPPCVSCYGEAMTTVRFIHVCIIWNQATMISLSAWYYIFFKARVAECISQRAAQKTEYSQNAWIPLVPTFMYYILFLISEIADDPMLCEAITTLLLSQLS